ncbi:collagen alpha-1(I) chain-like [Vulpes lagopus]|uniref:collagen alpha-1(I) chain-like n=1 Tax=Vulpes lagopus TaxID=494514 RepID=UPI001BC95B0B|nr:collagen alpha-1(I) chain-like [Vulpes lagopus]
MEALGEPASRPAALRRPGRKAGVVTCQARPGSDAGRTSRGARRPGGPDLRAPTPAGPGGCALPRASASAFEKWAQRAPAAHGPELRRGRGNVPAGPRAAQGQPRPASPRPPRAAESRGAGAGDQVRAGPARGAGRAGPPGRLCPAQRRGPGAVGRRRAAHLAARALEVAPVPPEDAGAPAPGTLRISTAARAVSGRRAWPEASRALRALRASAEAPCDMRRAVEPVRSRQGPCEGRGCPPTGALSDLANRAGLPRAGLRCWHCGKLQNPVFLAAGGHSCWEGSPSPDALQHFPAALGGELYLHLLDPPGPAEAGRAWPLSPTSDAVGGPTPGSLAQGPSICCAVSEQLGVGPGLMPELGRRRSYSPRGSFITSGFQAKVRDLEEECGCQH